MSAKKLVIETLNGGAAASGVTVKVSGCGELQTGATGQVFFLVDEPQVTVTVDGQSVHSGALDALPAKLTVSKDGGTWKAA